MPCRPCTARTSWDARAASTTAKIAEAGPEAEAGDAVLQARPAATAAEEEEEEEEEDKIAAVDTTGAAEETAMGEET